MFDNADKILWIIFITHASILEVSKIAMKVSVSFGRSVRSDQKGDWTLIVNPIKWADGNV